MCYGKPNANSKIGAIAEIIRAILKNILIMIFEILLNSKF